MQININGKTITCSGNNITIQNGKVIIDGSTIYETDHEDIKATISGDVNTIHCSGDVFVYNNAGNITCGGKCEVNGDVNGDIKAGGSVTCKTIVGDINAGGSVRFF